MGVQTSQLYRCQCVFLAAFQAQSWTGCGIYRAWAARMRQEKPDFFSSLADQQAPEYFWIGCSDSRVPVSVQSSTLMFVAPLEGLTDACR